MNDKLKHDLLAHLENLAEKYNVAFCFDEDAGIYDTSNGKAIPIYHGCIYSEDYLKSIDPEYAG